MKFFKKFLIYLAFILGGLIVIALGIFAFMYFSPNTPVLGFEYVLYKETDKTIYDKTTDLSVSGVKAVEIITEMSDIYIYPNSESDQIIVKQNQKFSGLVKAIEGDLTVDTTVQTKSFEEKTTEYKTFSVVSNEPSGWVSKNSSYIAVYISNNLSIDTIYARSNSGNVYYVSYDDDGTVLNCVDLYLKTSDSGVINISNKESISNYYLSTGTGSAKFDDTTSISANAIKFSTNSGSLKMTNAEKNATLTLTEGLYVNSNDNRYGPNIAINKLLGNLYVDAKNGYYKIDEIGSFGVYKTVAMTLKKSEINFGTVYAYVSLLSDTTESENNVSIDTLNYSANTNVLETGKGSVTINNLNGHLAVDSSSGNINIKNASVESNIYTYSTSGNINIKYEYVGTCEKNGTNLADINLKVITKTGNINLTNVSCLLEVKVQSSSPKSSLNISFGNVANNTSYDNFIEASDRKVNLKLVGTSDYLQFRIASTHAVELKGVTVGTDVSTPKDSEQVTNNDYLLDLPSYEDYSYGYRIGYTKDQSTYQTNAFNMWGVLCIKTTNNIAIEAQTTVTE